MREMLRVFFSAFTSFFRAFDLGARTVENLAMWAESESAAFEDTARVERTVRLAQLRTQLTLEAPTS